MPLDAVCLRALLRELTPELVGERIEKVQQPARDQVILLLRGGRRLYFNAGVNQPRIQLTVLQRENPAEPPMFCMLLRKHLAGGRIRSAEQPALERLVRLTVDVLDDFGRASTRTLVLECMGRRSNLILLDESEHIVDCLRRVDADMSAERQVLPGMLYRLPPSGGRIDPLLAGDAPLLAALSNAGEERTLSDWIVRELAGFSPLLAREIAFRAAGRDDVRLDALSDRERQSAVDLIRSIAAGEREEYFTPYLLEREGTAFDFTCLPILQYGLSVTSRRMENFSALLDAFCEERERQDRTRQKGQDLLRAVSSVRDRTARKLENQRQDYAATQGREQYRKQGELITANLYRLRKGDRELKTEDYYTEGAPELRIPLDPLLAPQQNAAKYFKLYNKAKAAEGHLCEQIEKGEAERLYLESVLQELSQAETESDFADIRAELTEGGYLRRQTGGRKQPKRASPYREYRSSGGFRILVGRSNLQNDRLTTHDADKRDLWFHAQKIHGSHVILCTGGAEPDAESLREAALLAAWFSQAKDSANVPVDYAPVRAVKKPAGARPGMVTYTAARTLYVTPVRPEGERPGQPKRP